MGDDSDKESKTGVNLASVDKLPLTQVSAGLVTGKSTVKPVLSGHSKGTPIKALQACNIPCHGIISMQRKSF